MGSKREWEPAGQAFVSSDGVGFVLDSPGGEYMVIKWFQWPRWFHTNTGIGNTAGMWWPSRKGRHSAWILCDRCGLPFEMPTGFWMAHLQPRGDVEFDASGLEWTGGPCPRCKEEDGSVATGTPLLTIVSDDQGRTIIAGSPESASMAWTDLVEVTDELLHGDVSVRDAARRLRSGGGPLTRFADWVDRRPVTAQVAGMLLAAIVGVVGQQLVALHQGDSTDEEQIVQIIDTVLDHYDRTHAPATPATPPAEEGEQGTRRPHRGPSPGNPSTG